MINEIIRKLQDSSVDIHNADALIQLLGISCEVIKQGESKFDATIIKTEHNIEGKKVCLKIHSMIPQHTNTTRLYSNFELIRHLNSLGQTAYVFTVTSIQNFGTQYWNLFYEYQNGIDAEKAFNLDWIKDDYVDLGIKLCKQRLHKHNYDTSKAREADFVINPQIVYKSDNGKPYYHTKLTDLAQLRIC